MANTDGEWIDRNAFPGKITLAQLTAGMGPTSPQVAAEIRAYNAAADTVALPPIPDGAREAVAKYLGCLPTAPIVTDVIEAARPHLYAAALRHASDRILCGDVSPDVRTKFEVYGVTGGLKALADEATRG